MAYVRTYARRGSGLNELGLASVRMCGPADLQDCPLELIPAYVRVFSPAGPGLPPRAVRGKAYVRMFGGAELLRRPRADSRHTYVCSADFID